MGAARRMSSGWSAPPHKLHHHGTIPALPGYRACLKLIWAGDAALTLRLEALCPLPLVENLQLSGEVLGIDIVGDREVPLRIHDVVVAPEKLG